MTVETEVRYTEKIKIEKKVMRMLLGNTNKLWSSIKKSWGWTKKSWGFTATELLLVTAIVSSIPTGAYLHAKNKALEINCQNNLRQINMALQMFIMTSDKLPSAAFYPKEPTKDKDSILVILESYGASKGVFVDPSAPEELKKLGLTYIWNDTFNGQIPENVPDASNQWLMIDMSAVSKDVPPAHRGGYNVLYVDGHVEWTDKRPEFIPDDKTQNVRELLLACR